MRGLIALYGESSYGRGAAEVSKMFLSSCRDGAHYLTRNMISNDFALARDGAHYLTRNMISNDFALAQSDQDLCALVSKKKIRS